MLHSTFDGVNTYETWVCDPLVTTPNANAIIRVYIRVQYWYESFFFFLHQLEKRKKEKITQESNVGDKHHCYHSEESVSDDLGLPRTT